MRDYLKKLKLIGEGGDLQNIAILTGLIAVLTFFIYLLSYSFFCGYYLENQNELLSYLILKPVPFNYRSLLFFGVVLVSTFVSFTLLIRRWVYLDIDIVKKKKENSNAVVLKKMEIISNIVAVLFVSVFFSMIMRNFNSGKWLDELLFKITIEIMSTVFIFIILFRKDIIVLLSSLSTCILILIISNTLIQLSVFSIGIINSDSIKVIFVGSVCLMYIFRKTRVYSITLTTTFLGYIKIILIAQKIFSSVFKKVSFGVPLFLIYLVGYVVFLFLVVFILKRLSEYIVKFNIKLKLKNKVSKYLSSIKVYFLEMIEKNKYAFLSIVALSLTLTTIQTTYYLGTESNNIILVDSYSNITLQSDKSIKGIVVGKDEDMYYISTDNGKLLIIAIDQIIKIE